MKTYAIPLSCLLYLSLTTPYVEAQHSDIAVYQNADFEVTLHDTGDDAQTELRYFARDFDFWGPPFNVYAGDDPGLQQSGLNPPNGYSALPGDMTLNVGLLPFHVPGVHAGNLLFWNGEGSEVEFSPIPDDHVMFVEDAAGFEVSLQGTLDRFEGLVGGVTDSAGGLHEHMVFSLEHNGQTPEVGFYAMGWQLGGVGVEASDLRVVILKTPSIPSSIEDMMDQWLSDNIDQITIAGDFDLDKEYTTDDIDALVMSIAAGDNDPAFDLNGDGATDSSDLTLWREIAGSVNNASGAAFLVGDANLDGVVDGQDYIAWNNHKFTSTSLWSEGDFTADGIVDGQDFIAWNNSKFQSADAATVPEPSTIGWGLTLVVATIASTRRRRA